MRVLKPCGELDLAAETICVESGCEIGREDFDHYLAVELGVCRDEDARHASAAELAVDTVGRSEDFLELRLQVWAQAAPCGWSGLNTCLGRADGQDNLPPQQVARFCWPPHVFGATLAHD
jgi:hypothetical protein